mmetsp:Transcript_12072/g.25860  ORF Transcript_12072/g.25860 Transcript_12072/m.25860 type:complete len:80 (+) Transcript_12072:641-880(+)
MSYCINPSAPSLLDGTSRFAFVWRHAIDPREDFRQLIAEKEQELLELRRTLAQQDSTSEGWSDGVTAYSQVTSCLVLCC